MQGLGHENRSRNPQVLFRGDEGRAAEVGGGADAFEDGGQGHEGVRVRVGEGVGAGLDGVGAGGGEGGGEELHVGFFVVGDVFQVAVVEGGVAGVEEHLLRHGREGLFVEDVFEVFELGRGG